MKKSELTAEITKALAKAQTEYNALVKDSTNPFFKSKYADLAACIESVREPLAKNGLAIVQSTDITENGTAVVETMILHTSGEWICGRYPLTPTKNDCQGLGSALTYARRYSLTAMLSIAAEDDDGNFASEKPNTNTANTMNPSKYAPVTTPPSYSAPNASTPWSEKVTKQASKVEKNGLKGSVALAKYISEYNKENKTDYKVITDFKTDELLLKLIKFVEELVPSGLL